MKSGGQSYGNHNRKQHEICTDGGDWRGGADRGVGKEFVDELAAKDELTVKQGKVANEELKRTVREQMQKIKDAPRLLSIDEVLSGIEAMSDEEREAVKAKLSEQGL